MTDAERPQPPDEVLGYYALGLEERRLGEGTMAHDSRVVQKR